MMLRVIVAAVLAVALDPAVIKEITDFRAKHEEDYRKQYVTLAGLFDLKPGINPVGSGPKSDIVLPEPPPMNVGGIVVSDSAVRFEPADPKAAVVKLKDQPVTAAIDLTADEKGPGDELAVGGVTFWVHMSGDRRTVR